MFAPVLAWQIRHTFLEFDDGVSRAGSFPSNRAASAPARPNSTLHVESTAVDRKLSLQLPMSANNAAPIAPMMSHGGDLATSSGIEVSSPYNTEAGCPSCVGAIVKNQIRETTRKKHIREQQLPESRARNPTVLDQQDRALHEDHTHKSDGRVQEQTTSNEPGESSTVMVRNIACRYLQNDVHAILSDTDLTGTFDFLHVPVNNAGTANRGYFFINFISTECAHKCKQILSGKVFGNRDTNKLCEVLFARVPGKSKPLPMWKSARM